MDVEYEEVKIHIAEGDPAGKMLFQCALAVAEETDRCILCVINEMNSAVQQMLAAGTVRHGMDPKPLIELLSNAPRTRQ